MKRLFAFIFLVLFLQSASAQSVCCVTAECRNWGDTLLVFVTECGSGREMADTVLMKHDRFSYDVKLNSPAIMNVTTPASLERRGEYWAERFVILPGESLHFKSYSEMEGTRFFRQYAQARRFVRSSAYRDSEDKYAAILDYVKQNRDDEACVTLITDYVTSFVMDERKLQEAFDLLSPEVRNGRMRPLFDWMLHAVQTKQSRGKSQPTLVGQPAKDFKLMDIHGAELQLSSFRGSYVLLDFWGSWCMPCLKGLSGLKEFYERNKGRMAVIGISCHDHEERWRKAVQENHLPWHNVFAPKNCKVTEDYLVNAFPTLVLISPDGRILRYANTPDSDIYAFIQHLLDGNRPKESTP